MPAFLETRVGEQVAGNKSCFSQQAAESGLCFCFSFAVVLVVMASHVDLGTYHDTLKFVYFMHN